MRKKAKSVDRLEATEYPKTEQWITPSFLVKKAIDEAKEIIYGDREKTYGRPDINFSRIASLWNAYIGGKFMHSPVFFKERDIALMMVLFKIARDENKDNRETLVDGIGYLACADRIARGDKDDNK